MDVNGRSRAFSHSAQPPLFFGVDNLFVAAFITISWIFQYVVTSILRLSYDIFRNTTISNFLLTVVEISGSAGSYSFIDQIMNRSPSSSNPINRENSRRSNDDQTATGIDELNDETTNENRNELTAERNLREGIDRIRMRFDISNEGQTILSFFQNILPFLIVFALKLMLDHVWDLVFVAFLTSFFLQADHHVQKIFSGGMPSWFFQVLYAVVYSSFVIAFVAFVELEDFGFANVFGMNLKYFWSGKYTTLTMASTFYGAVVIDTTFKFLTIIPKLGIAISPDALLPPHKKRRLMQFVEYCSQLYRCALPFGPWTRYFLFSGTGAATLTRALALTYMALKVRELFKYSQSVRKTLRFLFSESSFGSIPKSWEVKDQLCTVCHEEMSQPIKLDCGHIFCKVCIETWLDRNTTCPMCRTVVTKDADNDWKNGETSRTLRLF